MFEGFTEVTKAAFYARMNPLNVHPSVLDPHVTNWEMQDGSRRLIGRSLPGWRDSGDPNTPKRYFLKAA